MRAFLALLLALSAAAALPLASAAPADPTQDLASTTGQVLDTVEGAVDGAAPAAPAPEPPQGPDVGQAFAAVGAFLAQVGAALALGASAAASAVAGATAFAATALADGAAATGSFLASTALSAAAGLADAAGAAVDLAVLAAQALGGGVTLLASLAAGGAAAVGHALASALGFVAAQLAFLAGLYASLVGSLRPDGMPEPAFLAAASAGAAASAAAAGYGLGGLVRRFGWLAGLPAVGGFSRIEDDELLKHPVRAQVFQAIQASPGIHASELARRVGSGWGTIVHHLDKLEKGGLVAVRKVNNQKCFFEMGGKVSRTDMAIAGAVRPPSANQIAAFVQAHPMTSQKAMASELGISPALASFHVKKLVHLGVLDKARRGKETLLTASESLRRVLAGESGALAQPPVLVAATA